MEDFTMKLLQSLVVAAIIATTVFPAFGMNRLGRIGKQVRTRGYIVKNWRSGTSKEGITPQTEVAEQKVPLIPAPKKENAQHVQTQEPVEKKMGDQLLFSTTAAIIAIAQQKSKEQELKKYNSFNIGYYVSNFAGKTNLMFTNMKVAASDIKNSILNSTIISETKARLADLQDAAKQGLEIDKAKCKATIEKVKASIHEDDKKILTGLSRFFFGPSKKN